MLAMGCASSTPMVATAGSEMLKAATHVAGDVKQKGEAALEDATQTLNATVDTAKETVSTAVAGITNELGNAFKDGTEALDDAKHKVLEGLHLEEAAGGGGGGKPSETEGLSTSRAPTPALDADADSLKTSTPEPEIERALANGSANEEEAPPTPKPSLQEMAELSAQVDATVATETAAATTTTATAAAAAPSQRWSRRSEPETETDEDQRRPSTTEWEKLADQLAKSRKFKPYESFAHSQNQFSVYQDYTSLRDKPGHYDGHFSGGNSLETSASQSQSDLSSGHLTPAPTRRGHRDYAKFVGSEQPGSVSRASSRLSNVGGRAFDFNPQRERINLPIANARNAVGGRSLWARGQHDVLPEEPPQLRRSSMTIGHSQPLRAMERNVNVARSTSNLTSSSLQRQHEAKSKHKLRQSMEDVSKKSFNGSRRVSEAVEQSKPRKFADNVDRNDPIKSQRLHSSKPIKQPKESENPLHEAFKSMLMDSARDISSTVMLAKPLKTNQAKLHSPSHVTTCNNSNSPSNNKMPTPLASRASTFIAETTESRSSLVKYATPIETPQLQTPTRQQTAASRASASSVINALTVSPRAASKESTATTIAGHATPIRGRTNVEDKSQSPPASRSASRLSSTSSGEVVIKPLSHLNTPSVVSISPESCQVVMTEYEDNDLEAALARLADWRGSTATLHSLRSSNRNSLNSGHFDSRRTSPWLRRQTEHNSQSKDRRTFSSCGIAELTSPSKAAPLDRCEICCNEITMN
ncbi:uncharacterized protein LOC132792341 [Drosophila nasuta]|uniref:uncharacterized protein LOC132792341 n=1 Tax=Drosophila nasuta TaxID=42062 RepID=UPI00295F40C2|nr:uncharacterized protein LOC132792341 [Drosophila nasuta]